MVFADEPKKLISGNARFRKKMGCDRIISHSRGQRPFAMIVGCSDSRVPPEVIFDQADDIGRLFVIRVAGNIAQETTVMGSVEYAVECLKVPLVAVLGHTGCGAIREVIKSILHKSSDEVIEHEIQRLAKYVRPCRELVSRAALYDISLRHKSDIMPFLAKDEKMGSQLMIEANVDRQVNLIRNNHFVKARGPEVVGLVYSLDDGRVHLTNKDGKQLKF